MRDRDELRSRQVQVSAIKSLFDDIIDRHAEAYLSVYPEVKEFSNFEEKSGTSNYYIGMVWTNDFNPPQQQEAHTIRVRGSKAIANNKLVELDLNTILDRLIANKSQESFFPGQVIAFKAEPTTLKRQLTVTKFLDSMKIAPQMKSLHTQEKIVLAAASGPFMKPDQDDWTLYDRIIDSVRENSVTHLILTGPFVDMANKFCKTSYEAQWKSAIDKLIEGLHDRDCHIYIVPSNRDILPSSLRASYSYPCSKLRLNLGIKEEADVRCKIQFVTDPIQLDIDGLFIDVTSADVAFHMSRCISFVNRVDHMLPSVFRHLIAHGIYPIYPSHPDMAIDYPELRKFIQLDRLGPHIIVLPNQLGTSSVHSVENRLIVAMKRCSVGKQLIVIEIPPTSSNEGQVNSVTNSERHTYKIVDLIPRNSTTQASGDTCNGSNSTPSEASIDSAITIDSAEMAAASTDSSQGSSVMIVDTR